MLAILLVIHLLIAFALVVVVLLQRSEGGGLGIGSGSGGIGGFMTARGTANLLTRTTAILAGLFMAMSLLLAVMASGPRERRSIIDTPAGIPGAPASPFAPVGGQPAPAAPGAPAAPAETPPQAPIAR